MQCTWTLQQCEELTEFGSLHKLILRGFKFLAVKLKIVISLETLWDQTESHCCNFRRHWSCVWEEYLMVIWAQVTATSTKVLMTFDVLYIWTLIGSGHKQSQICMLFTLLVSWRGAQCVSTKSANTATNIHGDKEHAHKLQSTFCT